MLAAQQPQRRNILFVMVDEMRSDCMGCAGHQTVRTPTLDNLAKQGVLFRNAYTVSPVCRPSRASVFSGRYSRVHGVVRNGVPHNDGETFLPATTRPASPTASTISGPSPAKAQGGTLQPD